MSIPNYRVLLSYDSSQNVFRARSPELEHCFGEAKTRSEAIAHLETEIKAQLQNMQDQGKTAPKAIDDQEWSGEVTAHVSKILHKDLAWQARSEGIDLNQLISEMLAAGIENRRQSGRSSVRTNRPPQEGNRAPGGNRHDRDSGDWGHKNHGPNFSGTFDDRANFIQYVRGIEADGGREAAGRGKEKPRGHAKHHHQNNKRRQGRRPGGPSQGGQHQGQGSQAAASESTASKDSSVQSTPKSDGSSSES